MLLLALPDGLVLAAPVPPTGEWYTPDRSGVVRVAPCGPALCGVIVGLTDWPKDGSVLKDVHGTPQCHLLLLAGLRLHGDGRWHGTVTNPEDGKVYDAEVWVGADGAMRLHGYVLLELLGETQRWPPFDKTVTSDCHIR